MRYSQMTAADTETAARLYIEYYNENEDCCWAFEKAYARIRQMLTIKGSLCLFQIDDAEEIIGLAIGYYQEYDDLTAYHLEEIVIRADRQNKGYGKQFMREIERRVRESGATHLSLTSVNDEHHRHFYKSLGLHETGNLLLMAAHYGDEASAEQDIRSM